MRLIVKNSFLSIVSVCLVWACLVGVSGEASAEIIPNSVIVPHEYQFPPVPAIPSEGITGVLSYNLYRDEGKAWDGESGVRSLFATVNKFFHFFSIEGIDNVGFALQMLPGFARVQTKENQTINGFLDLPVGVMVYTKPTSNWTTGMEYWLTLPIGDNDVSNHSWDHQLAFLTNYFYKNFTFDGSVGVKLRGDSRHHGERTDNGDMLYANTVFGYSVAKFIEPYVKLDYFSAGSGKNETTGETVGSRYELQGSIGNYFKITDKFQFTVHYTKGLTGKNCTKTNGAELNFYWVW